MDFPAAPASPLPYPAAVERRGYDTSRPRAANGSSSTFAQPAASDASRPATRAESPDRTHTSTVGPAPEIVAPKAPYDDARSTSSIDRG
jgi:hypothetical protein